MNQKGFTLVEVLVAMLIFVLSAVSAIELVRGAVVGTAQTRQITIATWLLQNLMTQLETNIETVGFDDGCKKKTEAKFAAPYEDFQWIAYCGEIDFKISQTAAQVMQAEGEGEEVSSYTENRVVKAVFDTASKYITESLREIHAEVSWTDGQNSRYVAATTHVVRVDKPLPPISFSSIDSPIRVAGYTGSGGK